MSNRKPRAAVLASHLPKTFLCVTQQLLLSLCILLFASSAIADEPKRLAFVVGIGEYVNLGEDQKSLTRAVQDADGVGAHLGLLGFDVVGGVGKNLSRDEFTAKWRMFLDEVKPGRNDTVVIFFSGHGIEIEGRNYILAKNAPFKRAGRQGELERESISVTELLLDVQSRRPRLVLMILDACRTNPFIPPEFKYAVGLGGTAVTGDGVLVVYSASSNETAFDRLPSIPADSNPNSVFTRALLPMLDILRQPIPLYLDWTQYLKQKVREITEAAGVKQTPKAYSGLEGELCLLGPCYNLASRPPSPVFTSNSEACERWITLQNATDEQMLLDFALKARGFQCYELAVARLALLSRQKSSLYVVSIGIEDYIDPRLSLRSRGARREADAVAATLKKYMSPLYGRSQVVTVGGRTGTRANILSAFQGIRQSARPRDVVIVYLSGFALEAGGRPYFLPADARADDPESYVSLDEVQNIVGDTFGRVVLLVESCGVSLQGSLKRSLLDVPKDHQINVLAAALPGQVAFERAPAGIGLFTSVLLDGLSGKAFAPGRNTLTLGELGNYVVLQVAAQAAKGFRTIQNPYFASDDPTLAMATRSGP